MVNIQTPTIFRIRHSLIIQLARSEIFNDSSNRKSYAVTDWSFRYVTKNQRRKTRRDIRNIECSNGDSGYKGKSEWKKRWKILLYFLGGGRSNFVSGKSVYVVWRQRWYNSDTSRIEWKGNDMVSFFTDRSQGTRILMKNYPLDPVPYFEGRRKDRIFGK